MNNNTIDSLKKINENSKRLKEIIHVLTKYGLSDSLEKSEIDWLNKYLKKSKSNEYNTEKKEIRIRLALSELGTTFIKFGQLLSTRSDLIGKDLAEELGKLQNKTKSDPIKYVRSVIKKELGIKTIEEIFRDFSTKPIASASIGQVHTATLITGEKVVIKIIHEGIEEKIIEDMEIVDGLAHLAEKYDKNIKQYHPVQIFREFRKTLLNELDFTKELKNINLFTKKFSGNERVLFPHPFPNFSSKKILTMQYLGGVNIHDYIKEDHTSEEKNTIANEGARVYMDMIFRDNFYHADPHPGNFFIYQDGSIAVIDFGMVGSLTESNREKIEDLIIGVVEKDTELIKDIIIDIGSIPPQCDQELLSAQIDDFISEYLSLSLNEFDMSKAINQIIDIMQTNHIILSPDISLLLRVLVIFEGTARLLNPDINLTELFQSYYLKIVLKRISPKTLLIKAKKNVRHWENAIDLAPKVLVKLLNNADKSNFKVNLEHRNLENSVNSLVTGLLATALFIGSSMIISSRIGPFIGEFSIFGLAGILVSLYIGIRLMMKINRKDKEDESI